MHPRRACSALVAALSVMGVQIVAEAPDRGRVVHATGLAGLQELSQALGKTGRQWGQGAGSIAAV